MKDKIIKIKFFLTLCFFFPTLLFSQQKDFETWSSVELQYNISKKLRISLTDELRLKNNSTTIKKYFFDLCLSYKFNKYIKIAGNYRLIQRNNIDYSTGHRFYADLSLKKEIKRFDLSYRTRYHSQYIDINSSEDGLTPENYLRNKISIKYDIKKKSLFPFASYELFYQVGNPGKNEFNKMRFTVGLEYKINEKNNFDLFYRIQPRFNVNNPLTSYILGINYCLSLNN